VERCALPFLAAELPPKDARAALDCVLGLGEQPQGQAVQIARALAALPPVSQADYAARIRADVAAGITSDVRVSNAAGVLDALGGAKLW